MTMNWDAVAAIAGLLAAFAVALTVVYLALQIKASTRATHSQTYHLATSALAEMASIVGKDADTARMFRIGMEHPEQLNEDEATQFGYLGISLFRRFEDVYFQYQEGNVDEDFCTWGTRLACMKTSGSATATTSSGSSTAPACRRGGRNASSLSASGFGSSSTARSQTRSPRPRRDACEMRLH